MRKGSRASDARLRSFEKEKVYCKLTVASAILKGLLHVSLGMIEKCCRGGFIKDVSFFIALHELKKPPFYKPKAFL